MKLHLADNKFGTFVFEFKTVKEYELEDLKNMFQGLYKEACTVEPCENREKDAVRHSTQNYHEFLMYQKTGNNYFVKIKTKNISFLEQMEWFDQEKSKGGKLSLDNLIDKYIR